MQMGGAREKTNVDSCISETAKTHAVGGNQPEIYQAARTVWGAPARDAAHARANAENRALENGLSRTLCSGCHCTPTTNRAPGRLTAPICPPRATAALRSVEAGR